MKRYERFLIAISICFVLPAHAKFMRVETEKVPVDRLVANIEKQIGEKPNDATLHSQLGRLYAMAYALKSDQVAANKRDQTPWYGYTDADHPPRQVTKGDAQISEGAAKKHLQLAITEYEKALKIIPAHLASRVGLAWCQDQAGNKTEALSNYRRALAQAWAKENTNRLGMDTPWTAEVVDYMLPLLEPTRDADEIARLKEHKATVMKSPRPITPILIPLEANTPFEDLVNPTAGVTFDLDGSGLPRQWGWITPKAAWLVYDARNTGQVTSGLQLFGNATFWIFWGNGYEALSALDNDGDQELRGDELRHLALWQDKNGNGVSDAGEVKPLADFGIVGLSCRSERHPNGFPFNLRGVVLNDGSARPSYDWIVPAEAVSEPK